MRSQASRRASIESNAFLLLALCLATAGCATTRGTLAIAVPLPENPESDIVFRQPEVADARRFQAKPPDPSIPSLKYSKELDDPAITARAIARKRNTYGMAMGDILLPEGETVSGLTANAIVRSFREAGYRVVAADDPAFESAIPIQARVDQFWAWVTPGFWAMAIEFEARVQVRANFESLADGRDVRGYIRLKSAAVSTEKWRTTIDRGLDDFSLGLRQAIAEAARIGAEEADVAAPPAAPKSPLELCLDSCRELTDQSKAECFDACRRAGPVGVGGPEPKR